MLIYYKNKVEIENFKGIEVVNKLKCFYYIVICIGFKEEEKCYYILRLSRFL